MSKRIDQTKVELVIDLPNEIWVDIEGFESVYQISNLGRVKSLKRMTPNGVGFRFVRERIRATHFSKSLGYLEITLNSVALNKKERLFIHRLVAKAFIPNPEGKPEVNHIDGNKLNASASNLEWVTGSENLKHAHKTGLKKAYWKGRIIHNSKPIIAIQDLAIMEFPSVTHCARHFNAPHTTISKAIDSNQLFKNHLIYSA
jgi:hypothetical protein